MNHSQAPLAGIKVLDFSTLLPGPYATMLLADMGADVLRIESPTRADMLKEMTPKFDQRSYAHLTINRNKRSIALDLKHPDSKAIIKKLIAQADVVIEQFRPGVMQRLGLDYPSLKSINSRLIYCSITGYGQTGPFKDRAGHDINFLALSGLASYSGKTNTGPVLSGTQIADIAGGSHHAVMGILAAIIQRGVSGVGQLLDISMSDCALALNTMYGATALASGENPTCGKELLNGGIFYDYYRTQDDRFISVGGLEPQFAKAFFDSIGQPGWLNRAAEPPGKQQALKDDISQIIASKSLEQWRDFFSNLDVCVEPVLTINEASKHPHFIARKMIVDISIDKNKVINQIASPIKFNSPAITNRVGVQLGANSKEVLLEQGFSISEIEQLIASNVVYQMN